MKHLALLATLAPALLTFPQFPVGRSTPERGSARESLPNGLADLTQIEGRVGSGARPAPGVPVAASTGEKAITEGAGRHALRVRLPHGAEALEAHARLGAGAAAQRLNRPVHVNPGAHRIANDPLHASAGSGCQPDWIPTFGALPGTDGTVWSLATYDEGHGQGETLFVAGDFTLAGDLFLTSLARWDGAAWSAVGGGIDGTVRSLAVHDDGAGPALYVGGTLASAGGVPVQGVARWNGTAWSAVGSPGGIVQCLASLDDGSGPVLHAGTHNGVWRWSGSSWSLIGGNTDGVVYALAMHDDGSGPELYATGWFNSIGAWAANGIARWDGTSWSALGSGLLGIGYSLATYDDGVSPQPALYVGGGFTTAGGLASEGIARWRGGAWSAVPGAQFGVHSMLVHDDGTGSGPSLVLGTWGGALGSGVHRRTGDAWEPEYLHVGNGGCLAVAVFDDGSGSGPGLVAGGSFTYAGLGYPGIPIPHYTPAARVVRWKGSDVTPLGHGIAAPIYALASHAVGTGGVPELVAGGEPGGFGSGLAKWTGSSWSSLALPAERVTGRCFLTHDEGTGAGPALFAAGYFVSGALGGAPANGIGRFDGSTWSALGGGLVHEVLALATYDDLLGGGPALFAGGSFSLAGGQPAPWIARWDGSSWSPLASQLNNTVRALAVFYDGTGGKAHLFAAGSFSSAGGQTAGNIARWDGTGWLPVGGGFSTSLYSAHALVVHDDGSGAGPALYAGGNFPTAGGVLVNGIARWNGSTWSALGSGVSGGSAVVRALAVYDDGAGGGPALFVGGDFEVAGGIAAQGLARWDGSAWSPVGTGFVGGGVRTLAVHDDGHGPALYVGGDFLRAPSGDAHVAKYGGCASTPSVCVGAVSGAGTLDLVHCGTLKSSYAVTSDGTLSQGTWNLTLAPGLPLNDGWSVGLSVYAGTTTTLSFSALSSGTTGSWPAFLTWTGLCNGYPVSWSRTVTLRLIHPCATGNPYCFGGGAGVPCPCENSGGPGAGCLNSSGLGARLMAGGTPDSSSGDFVLVASGTVPFQPGLFFQGTQRTNNGLGLPFGNGLRCVGGVVTRIQVRLSDGFGNSHTTAQIQGPSSGMRFYQLWYRDPLAPAPCAWNENLSNGLDVFWTP